MGAYAVTQLVKRMVKKKIQVEDSKVLILGLSFKENCPDIRNTRVVDVVKELQDYNIEVDIYDPWVSSEEVKQEYGLDVETTLKSGAYDAIVLAVAHDEFKSMGAEKIRALGKAEHVLYDLKYILEPNEVDIRL